ncbi:unnamed protein product [Orchesella dallaii]|uniref:EB domain-containing protein n=1 Tax=Orchesella dallaii TaxID=48710 RepID=A0ABP1QCU7_9HEXA
MNSPLLISFLYLISAIVTCSQGQLDFWESGTQDLGQACSKSGILGLLPNLRCQTLGGSASCKTNALGWGTCRCNQGSSTHVDNGDHYGKCVGLVGAICTAEKPNFIPEKYCTPNAECVAIQGKGYSVGRCQCLYGFKEGDDVDNKGLCIPDPAIEIGDRSTPRPTTTTEAPDRGEFVLPIFDLIIGQQFVSYGEDCHEKALLNKTRCKTYEGTVSCLNRKCQCNTEENSYFDEEHQTCVGVVGSHCFTGESGLGIVSCTDGADCVVDEGEEGGNSVGVCQCLYGYILQPDGKCFRDPDIANPSTARPIDSSTTPLETTSSSPGGDSSTTSGPPGGGSSSSTTPGNGSGATFHSSGNIITVITLLAIGMMQV